MKAQWGKARRKFFSFACVLCSCALVPVLGGCGYTSKTSLPDHIKSVHVEKVENTIDITTDVTSKTAFKTYRPGIEVEMRNALQDQFIFDGHLKVADKDKADAVLRAQVTDFRRDPLRYNSDDSVQEFRVSVTGSFVFSDARTDAVIWSTQALSGSASYFLSGRLAKTEDEAVAAALEDLARHIVESVLEVW